MKKNYFMLAAATMMFAACAETDLVNEIAVEETPQAIGFDAFANKTTRAEITKTDDLKTEDGGFHVWGYKNRGSEDEYTVFDNEVVSWDATNSKWGYTNTQYWDKMSTYKFYAVAPKAGSATYAIGDGTVDQWGKYMIKITNADNSVDYLIDRDGTASSLKDANDNVLTGLKGFDNGVVSFNFNHIMSKISFKLKAGVAEKIVVTSLTMTGWNDNVGTFTQSASFDTRNRNNTEWKMTAGDNGSFVIIDANSNPNGVVLENTMNPTSTTVGNTLITVPQNIAASKLTFTISYKLIRGVVDGSEGAPNDDPKDEVFTDQVGVLADAQSWYTDTHTTYTISVTPDAIEFGDPTVLAWSYTDDKDEEKLPL